MRKYQRGQEINARALDLTAGQSHGCQVEGPLSVALNVAAPGQGCLGPRLCSLQVLFFYLSIFAAHNATVILNTNKINNENKKEIKKKKSKFRE